MRAVKSQHTSPELIIRKRLRSKGYSFRVHGAELPGVPDIVFPKRHKVIFVHGCFWHGHKCKRGNRSPKTNVEYWIAKIGRNRRRDVKVRRQLKERGWSALTIWECQLKDTGRLETRLEKFLRPVG